MSVWSCENEGYLSWPVGEADALGFRNGAIALILANDIFVAFSDLLPAGITLLSSKEFRRHPPTWQCLHNPAPLKLENAIILPIHAQSKVKTT